MSAAVVAAARAAKNRHEMERIASKPKHLARTNAVHVQGSEHHEKNAAATIARAYRRTKMGKMVHRSVLLDRVSLEEQLCPGVVRLVLFVLLFVFLILANTGVGITSEHKRHITTLMGQRLDLDEFLSIKSLEGVREYLPHLSRSLKQFSMSSGARFQNQDATAIEILGPRTTFNAPVRVLGLNPHVGRGDFTLTAWVDTSASARERENLLRMPLATNPALSCWAWSHPSQLRFGAHDFYSTEAEPEEWEEVVKVGGPLGAGLTHEVLILRNNTLTFYRNAQPVQSLALRREMTECLTPGVFEVGDRGVAMSSVKFYPRALLDGEVQEIFFGGQPLSELATGTVLEHVELDTTEEIKVAIQGGTGEVSEAVEATRQASNVNSIVGLATTKALQQPPAIDQLYLEDGAPHPVLWQNDPGLLSPRNLLQWEAAGRPSNLSSVLTEEWRAGPHGQYYSFFDNPVYGARLEPEVNPDRRYDPPLTNEGPEWDQTVTGLTFSYWLQPVDADKMFWCDVSFRGKEEGDRVDHIQLTNYGHVLWLDFRRKWGSERFGPWKFLTFLDRDSGRLDERFIFTKYVNKPGPAAWRHVVFTVDFTSRAVLLYFDGRLFANSLIEEEGDPFGINYEPFPEDWTPAMLNRMRVHTFSGTLSEWGGCKLAQARVYPRVLSDSEILHLQNTATWDDGSKVKQCADAASDFDFADTPEVDSHLRSCAWYHETKKSNPEVCLSAEARAMCPMSCQGRRSCYDGSLYTHREEGQEAKVHTVFSHIRHIVPRNQTVICPAHHIDKEQLYRDCLQDRAENPEIPPWEYAHPGQYIFDQIKRPNLNKCEELVAALDEEQCGWNASWVPEFKAEWAERKEVSISFWMRPKEGSFGMPNNFWPSFHMYSRLRRPYTLLEGSESFPMFEPLWRFFFNVAEQRNDRLLIVSNHVPYAQGWTYVHFQAKRRESGGGWSLCGALNAVKATCIELDDQQPAGSIEDGLGWPEEFLEGIEFTTEMLVSPIEVQAKAFTPAQIQQRYYTRRDNMAKILGPATPPVAEAVEEEVRNFDSRVALVTPPLIFQSRAEAVACNESTTRPLLTSQFDLMRAAHCQSRPDTCQISAPEEMATCLGGESREPYFGLTPFEFEGRYGVCDFLYTLADHDVVVRNGRTIPTRLFLDGRSTSFVVLIVLHMPNNGMSTLLELAGKTDGFAVQTKIDFFHYAYLSKTRRGDALLQFAAVFAIILVILLVNLLLFIGMWNDKQRWHVAFDVRHSFAIFYDILQSVVVGAFSIMVLLGQLGSEEKASAVLEKLSAVPFSSPRVSFEAKLDGFFEAAEELYSQLRAEGDRTTFAFVIMILMLIRIIRATAAHPRTAVLTGTLAKGLSDLYHYALLFMIIFFFFSYAATWLFADTREEFRDLAMSMETQFQILLGNLPRNFSSNEWLIIYVVLCSITLFFLMLNFLLALVVDAYMGVREEIVRNEAENEFFHDVVLTVAAWYKIHTQKWPSLRAIQHLMKKSIASRSVSAVHLVLQGVELEAAKSMIEHYHQMKNLRADKNRPRKRNHAASDSKPASPDAMAISRVTSQHAPETIADVVCNLEHQHRDNGKVSHAMHGHGSAQHPDLMASAALTPHVPAEQWSHHSAVVPGLQVGEGAAPPAPQPPRLLPAIHRAGSM